jgi:hypothetical protein
MEIDRASQDAGCQAPKMIANVVTGERAEESASRAQHQVFEPHCNDA